mmetsp:Transcript_19772/g.51355  ORF Transcript_19772/g.51355 Transcript_19772/m.51355 type:complete len:86 (-) Transcript_19772:389-646(-)
MCCLNQGAVALWVWPTRLEDSWLSDFKKRHTHLKSAVPASEMQLFLRLLGDFCWLFPHVPVAVPAVLDELIKGHDCSCKHVGGSV